MKFSRNFSILTKQFVCQLPSGLYILYCSRITQLFYNSKDPWETINLADFPEYQEKIDIFRMEMKSISLKLVDMTNGERTKVDFWAYR